SAIRLRRTPEDNNVLDIGVMKLGQDAPAYAEQLMRVYDGYETHSGSLLGRGGAIFAWHPSEDVLFFFDDNKLRRIDFRENANRTPTVLMPDWGRLNGDYLAFSQDGSAVLVGILGEDSYSEHHHIKE